MFRFGSSRKPEGFRCRACGQHHPELPLCYGAEAPVPWLMLPEEERAGRGELTSELCVIDGRMFFVLGNLDIPIHGSDQPFRWNVWLSLSEPNFRRMVELWENPARVQEPPYFGWLCTDLPSYPESTLHLKTHVHTRPVGQRPWVEVERTCHPLAVEQRKGISWKRVQEIAEQVLHAGS